MGIELLMIYTFRNSKKGEDNNNNKNKGKDRDKENTTDTQPTHKIVDIGTKQKCQAIQQASEMRRLQKQGVSGLAN